MIVMKFGGSSLKDAGYIKRATEIIKERLSEDPAIVVSAHADVTDMLIKVAQRSSKSAKPDLEGFSRIQKLHHDIVDGLALKRDFLQQLFQELELLLKGVCLLKELTPRTLDHILSFGERLSARIIARYLSSKNIPARAIDGYTLGILTNSNFGNATPLEGIYRRIARNIKRSKALPIIAGFIGKNSRGDITTLGRGGSDYTAAIVAASINAKELQLWGNTPGIMSVDPALIKNAKPIKIMNFEETSELAYYKGRLQPHMLLPAIRKNIPIRVLDIRNPNSHGTLIVSTASELKDKVKSIAYKKEISLINFTSPQMLIKKDILAEVFNILARYNIAIDMVSSSKASISLATEGKKKELLQPLKELSTLGSVNILHHKAILCVVGKGLRNLPGLPNKILLTLESKDIKVEMISQGALGINIALLINQTQLPKALRILHELFFK
jgi:aspartate kinase